MGHVFPTTIIVEIHNLFERVEDAVVHVGRSVDQISQRLSTELADIPLAFADEIEPQINLAITVDVLGRPFAVILKTVCDLLNGILQKTGLLRHANVVEFLVVEHRAVVALDALGLACEQFHAPNLRLVQCRLIALHVKVERCVRLNQHTLKSGDGTPCIVKQRNLGAKNLLEHFDIIRTLPKALLHHVSLSVARKTGVGGFRLGFQCFCRSIPEQFPHVGRVNNRMRISPMGGSRIAAANG